MGIAGASQLSVPVSAAYQPAAKQPCRLLRPSHRLHLPHNPLSCQSHTPGPASSAWVQPWLNTLRCSKDCWDSYQIHSIASEVLAFREDLYSNWGIIIGSYESIGGLTESIYILFIYAPWFIAPCGSCLSPACVHFSIPGVVDVLPVMNALNIS